MTSKNNEKKFVYKGITSLQDFATSTGINSIEIIKFFFLKGIHTTSNTALKEDDCRTLCDQFKLTLKVDIQEKVEEDPFVSYLDFSQEELVTAAPIVTIMGHVNHGKTTLLDQIRKSNVVAKEYANITQHIGAYQIIHNKLPITFLDTPGHEAFTKIRSTGGKVSNIVVLVISAVDGVQPQTIEAIHHAVAAKVKIIIFANKIDKGEHLLPEIKKDLTKHDILIEELGGDIFFLTGSAIKNQGISELFDAILLIAEMEQYATTLSNPVVGTVIETNVEKGTGNTATIITHRGILKVGDFIVMPSAFGKIRNIIDENKTNLKELYPSKPAKISGLKDLPHVGEKFISYKNESEAKKEHEKIIKTKETKLFDLQTEENQKLLNFIIRADVSGTLDAIKHLLKDAEIRINSSNIGPVNESDIQLASISKSQIINFNQKVSPNIESIAKSTGIEIKTFKSIYQLEEEVQRLQDINKVVEKVEQILGMAKVVKIWQHSKIGTIAGSIVESGKIQLKNKVRLFRNDKLITTSTIKTFKTESFEIKEAKESQECGIVFQNWNDIQVGDFIQAFDMVDAPVESKKKSN